MATSFGARRMRLAQRAVRTSSAVESGPPEIARIRPRKPSRPKNSAFASSSRTACSAVDTFLFPIDGLLHGRRSARIFSQDFAERRARGFLLTQSGQRLAKPQQRVRRARGGFVFRGDREEGLGGIMVLLVLKQAFAEPILRLARQPVARIFLQEIAECVAGRPAIFLQDVAVSEIVLVFGRAARRQRRLHRAGAA